ncbi:hypothetical protein [Sphingomonas faeni]|uniref:hypothetical protein n=1 Tax=Sphingomonas faeni TaxID=185950 RepID=UPI00334ED7AD
METVFAPYGNTLPLSGLPDPTNLAAIAPSLTVSPAMTVHMTSARNRAAPPLATTAYAGFGDRAEVR